MDIYCECCGRFIEEVHPENVRLSNETMTTYENLWQALKLGYSGSCTYLCFTGSGRYRIFFEGTLVYEVVEAYQGIDRDAELRVWGDAMAKGKVQL